MRAGLVVGSVTTSEYLVLYVFDLFVMVGDDVRLSGDVCRLAASMVHCRVCAFCRWLRTLST
ncbi:hypothetical protein BDP67DRAFT_518474 [Colletotrichum lupini]|nr:hypothetical protein BDP67DRAFT_518474 [Colletotrichum lupini]